MKLIVPVLIAAFVLGCKSTALESGQGQSFPEIERWWK